jgi:hypothetical protein
MPSHPAWNPPENGHTSQFGAVIADNDLGLAPLADELFEFAHHADAAERSIDHGRQAFAAEVINDAEDAEAPPVTESVRDEVERPPFIDRAGQTQRVRVPNARLRPRRRRTINLSSRNSRYSFL